MKHGTKGILQTCNTCTTKSIHNRWGGGVICEDAQMVYMMIVDYRYHVKIVKNTFNNSIFLHRRDIQEPDVIVKPDGEYHMSFVWQDG